MSVQNLGRKWAVAAALIVAAGAGSAWVLADALPQQRAFSNLVVRDAEFDDTAHLLKIRKLSGSLSVRGHRSFTLAAALYRNGERVPTTIAGGGIRLRETQGTHELRFVAGAIDLAYLPLGDAEPNASRLMLILEATAAGGGTGKAGPAVHDLPKELFDVGQVRGQVLFNDRHLPEAGDGERAVIPLAAWIIGEGPIEGPGETSDIDEFARAQFAAGGHPDRAVLIFYLESAVR